jgi:hypothetical protein
MKFGIGKSTSTETEVLTAVGYKEYCKMYFWDMQPKSYNLVDLANVSEEHAASVFGVVSTPQIVQRI